MNRRIIADRDRCIGSGQCLLTAPELFDQGEDGLVTVLNDRVEMNTADGAVEAALLCPARAITVEER